MGDLARVAELEKACNPIPWTPSDLRAFTGTDVSNSGSNPGSVPGKIGRLAVLKGTEKGVGYICAQATGEEAEILVFGVDPEYRRRGIGRCLLFELKSALRSLECRSLFLEVREGNEAALSLYRSVGFAENGIRPRYYADTGEDAKILRWDLFG